MRDRKYQSVLRVRNALLLLAVVLAVGVVLTGWMTFSAPPEDPGTEESELPQVVVTPALVPTFAPTPTLVPTSAPVPTSTPVPTATPKPTPTPETASDPISSELNSEPGNTELENTEPGNTEEAVP